jgi:heat shock protein HslJ
MTAVARSGIGALAAFGLLAGCATMTSAAEAPSLDGTAWVLFDLPGHALVPGSSVTLQFADGHLSGSDGCNRYSGSYSVQGATLAVPANLASTQMACDPGLMDQARAYVSALRAAKSYRVSADRLELLSATGLTLATLAAQSRSLAGTSWHATGINNGKQAVSSLVRDSTVTLNFGADGVATGSAGCNNFRAPYTADGAKVSFGPAVATRKMCAQPEGVMEQEQNFLNALGTVTTSRIEGDRLELRTATGALAMALSRDAVR